MELEAGHHNRRGSLRPLTERLLLAVVAKHINIDHDQVRVTMQRGDIVSTLDIDIEVPHSVLAAAR